MRYLDIERVLFELLPLTDYVRYLDIERVLLELLGLTNYVRYLDIELVLFELLALTNYVRYIHRHRAGAAPTTRSHKLCALARHTP